MIKVTAVIPVYNVEDYLERCLDSICGQTLKEVELICINDCSSDNSLKILNEYALKDNRITVINFKENKGASFARNKGIQEAQGEFISFVDSDDYIDLDFYEKLYVRAKEANADVVKALFKIIAGKHSYLTELNVKIEKNKIYFFGEFPTALYKTSFIRENKICFNEELHIWEDPLFSIEIAQKANKIIVINDTKYNYMRRANSISHSSTKEDIDCWIKAAKMYLAIQKNEEDYKIILYDLIINLFFTNLCLIKEDTLKQYAIDNFRMILQLKPEYNLNRDYDLLLRNWNKEKFFLMSKKLRENMSKK